MGVGKIRRVISLNIPQAGFNPGSNSANNSEKPITFAEAIKLAGDIQKLDRALLIQDTFTRTN